MDPFPPLDPSSDGGPSDCTCACEPRRPGQEQCLSCGMLRAAGSLVPDLPLSAGKPGSPLSGIPLHGACFEISKDPLKRICSKRCCTSRVLTRRLPRGAWSWNPKDHHSSRHSGCVADLCSGRTVVHPFRSHDCEHLRHQAVPAVRRSVGDARTMCIEFCSEAFSLDRDASCFWRCCGSRWCST